MTSHKFPILSFCEHPGCGRLTHLRLCPVHVDDEQRDLERLRDEALLDLDLTRERQLELVERVEALDRALGMRRRGE
jgi:hypothetical protein